MGRPTNEEAKKKHLSELNIARVNRYFETHEMQKFSATLTKERYDQIDKALRENGMTKKEFIENAIDQYLQAKNKA